MQLIRFKVVHASRLLMGLIIAVLVVVLAVMIVRIVIMENSAPVSSNYSDTNIVQMPNGNEAVAAFAAASSLPPASALFSDGERHEDEHQDEVAPPMIIEKIPYETPPPDESAPMTAPSGEAKADTQKRVLIYHTHTHEAYQQDPKNPYVQQEEWRTEDQNYSVVRVGAELAKLLSGYGIQAVHDTTDHEPPKLGTAYVRSLETLEKYAGETFDCYIDLHRDAYVEGQSNPKVTLSGNGKPSAQLMMLIGNGDGYDEKPFYTENIAFARQLTLALNQIQGGLCKNVLVKKGRYNQHIGKRAIIVEVGNNMNTLDEAINAMPALAQALNSVLSGEVFLSPTLSPETVPVSAGG